MTEEQITESVNTENETDRKCPECGGVMHYDPATRGLKCCYCDHTEVIEALEKAAELRFDDDEVPENNDWKCIKKSVICKSCGAESIYDAADIASVCPYCGSTLVVEQDVTEVKAPGGVCPFYITREDATQRFKKWIKRRIFCPSKAKKTVKNEKINGVYLPYWTFDTDTHSDYSAKFGISRTTTDAKGNKHTRIDWYPCGGSYDESINDELVIATTSFDNGILRNVAPFDTENNTGYKPEYLAGFSAQRYMVDEKQAWETAKESIHNTLDSNITSQIESDHSTSHVSGLSFDTVFSNITYKYLLLPVWMSAFRYKDKIYQFMVNGQTGRVSGKTPISALRVIAAVLIVAAIIFGVILVYENM